MYKTIAYIHCNATVDVAMAMDSLGNVYRLSNYKTRMGKEDVPRRGRKRTGGSHCTVAAAILMEMVLIQRETNTQPTI